MSLRSAVAKVMALSPDDRMGATIFRNGEPPILDRAEIEDIAFTGFPRSSLRATARNTASEWQNGNGSSALGRTHGGPTMFARVGARAHRFVK